jgi:hypothetical protein
VPYPLATLPTVAVAVFEKPPPTPPTPYPVPTVDVAVLPSFPEAEAPARSSTTVGAHAPIANANAPHVDHRFIILHLLAS